MSDGRRVARELPDFGDVDDAYIQAIFSPVEWKDEFELSRAIPGEFDPAFDRMDPGVQSWLVTMIVGQAPS